PCRGHPRSPRERERLGACHLQELPGAGRALGPRGPSCGRAQQQGGSAKLHRAMLAFQGDFTVENILTLGKSVGLDAARLKTDMMSPATQKTVRENMTLAAALRLDATPSFVIGDR